jgi:hypothetical protein
MESDINEKWQTVTNKAWEVEDLEWKLNLCIEEYHTTVPS